MNKTNTIITLIVISIFLLAGILTMIQENQKLKQEKQNQKEEMKNKIRELEIKVDDLKTKIYGRQWRTIELYKSTTKNQPYLKDVEHERKLSINRTNIKIIHIDNKTIIYDEEGELFKFYGEGELSFEIKAVNDEYGLLSTFPKFEKNQKSEKEFWTEERIDSLSHMDNVEITEDGYMIHKDRWVLIYECFDGLSDCELQENLTQNKNIEDLCWYNTSHEKIGVSC